MSDDLYCCLDHALCDTFTEADLRFVHPDQREEFRAVGEKARRSIDVYAPLVEAGKIDRWCGNRHADPNDPSSAVVEPDPE